MFNIPSIIFLLSTLSAINGFSLIKSSSCLSKNFVATGKINIFNQVPLRTNGAECGEDDFVISSRGDFNLLGVADGVGSWSDYNVDPKIFVTELMKTIDEKYKAIDTTAIGRHDMDGNTVLFDTILNAVKSLDAKSKTRQELLMGSCTLVALSINLRTLHANSYLMGDAGYMVIRNREIVERSVDQLKAFNLPNQLGLHESSDHPNEGNNGTIKLRVGDIIVMGSDGLFDNIFDQVILKTVNNFMDKTIQTDKQKVQKNIDHVVKYLTLEAKKVGESTSGIKTPFGKEVKEEFEMDYEGGKNDDTTITVAIITQD